MKKRYYIISGVIAYLVFLIALTPAAPVLSMLQPKLQAVTFEGVSGRLWNARVSTIHINREYTLSNTHWQLNGWRLLIGELALDISSHFQQQPLTTRLALTASGTITAHDLKISLDAASLAQIAQLPLAQLSGEFKLQLEQLKWKPEQTPHAVGILNWNNAAITVAETAQLGNIKITLLDDETQPIAAQISNQGGQIKLEGEANVGEDGAYRVQLNMLPNQNASGSIRGSLSMIAKPKPDGSYQIDNNGNLKQFGLM